MMTKLPLVFLFATVILISESQAQVEIRDSLLWGSDVQVASQTSPVYELCDDTTVFFEISTDPANGFRDIRATTNPDIPYGVVFPAFSRSFGGTSIPISIRFSVPIDSLALLIVDLDEDVNNSIPNPEESIHSFSRTPDSVISTVGQIVLSGDSIIPRGNNCSGWAIWNDTISEISFVYSRPGFGYGLVIGEVRFKCDTLVDPEPPPPPTNGCDSTELTMPNIFTPNGDGINDFFEPHNDSCFAISSMSVYTRWGNRIFYSELPIPSWDGHTFAGATAADGTYFWIIEYSDENQNTHTQKGVVSLVR
jgi:gliding motility-associated-like protein